MHIFNALILSAEAAAVKAIVEANIRPTGRSYFSSDLLDPVTKQKIVDAVTAQYGPSIVGSDAGNYQAYTYNAGDYMPPHDDMDSITPARAGCNAHYTMSVMLTDGFTGGVLTTEGLDQPAISIGDAIAFDSSAIHSVSAIETGQRVVLEVLDQCVYAALASGFVIQVLETILNKAIEDENTTLEEVVKLAVWRAR